MGSRARPIDSPARVVLDTAVVVSALLFDGGRLAWIAAGDAACYGLFSSLGFADAGLRRTFTAVVVDPAARRG